MGRASQSRNGAVKVPGLVYVNDRTPGIQRVHNGRGFGYVSSTGRKLTSQRMLARFRALVIPPAWREVWISPDPNGHIQATGRDARGRKQYLYHPHWREFRDRAKYDHVVAFAERLGRLRDRVDRDLRRVRLTKDKVVATVVSLLQATYVRVGNEEYAKANQSFGLTTLRDHHVSFEGNRVRFQFRGKSGVQHVVDLNDRRLSRIIKACQDLPGEELFQYETDDGCHPIGSSDVNGYLRRAMGRDFTAKDFRTWAGTVMAAMALREAHPFQSEAQAKRQINWAVEQVAHRLGNTTTVCRKCYVHPAIFEAYRSGRVHAAAKSGRTPRRLNDAERMTYRLLRAVK